MNNYLPKSFYKFCLIFLSVFACCYYGFKIIYGAAIPGGTYFPFVEKYFNIASWIRQGLMVCTKYFVSVFNVNTYRESEYILRAEGGGGIILIYGCLGIGVNCFWIAYCLASTLKIKSKLSWLFFGISTIWIINVTRISLVLLASKNNWIFPLGIDHHTWFNIVSYLFIFIMIYFFEKSIKQKTVSKLL